MNDISVIVCVRNSAAELKVCLESVRANNPRELIVVDGNSSDGSCEIAQQLADKVLRDEGRGLSYARRIGVEAATGKYVLHLGPDFILSKDFLIQMTSMAQEYGYQGIGAQTRLARFDTIWDEWMDYWWKFMRGTPGPREVIGTPCLFEREILLEEPFSEQPLSCDDTELCLRLGKRGYRLGIVPLAAYDISGKGWRDIYRKFVPYGRSDADFYALNAKSWTTKRKIKSWTHPLRQTWQAFIWTFNTKRPLSMLLFFALICVYRYYGWIKYSHRN